MPTNAEIEAAGLFGYAALLRKERKADEKVRQLFIVLPEILLNDEDYEWLHAQEEMILEGRETSWKSPLAKKLIPEHKRRAYMRRIMGEDYDG